MKWELQIKPGNPGFYFDHNRIFPVIPLKYEEGRGALTPQPVPSFRQREPGEEGDIILSL